MLRQPPPCPARCHLTPARGNVWTRAGLCPAAPPCRWRGWGAFRCQHGRWPGPARWVFAGSRRMPPLLWLSEAQAPPWVQPRGRTGLPEPPPPLHVSRCVSGRLSWKLAGGGGPLALRVLVASRPAGGGGRVCSASGIRRPLGGRGARCGAVWCWCVLPLRGCPFCTCAVGPQVQSSAGSVLRSLALAVWPWLSPEGLRASVRWRGQRGC